MFQSNTVIVSGAFNTCVWLCKSDVNLPSHVKCVWMGELIMGGGGFCVTQRQSLIYISPHDTLSNNNNGGNDVIELPVTCTRK